MVDLKTILKNHQFQFQFLVKKHHPHELKYLHQVALHHQRIDNKAEFDKDIEEMDSPDVYFENGNADIQLYFTLAWIGMENDGNGSSPEDVIDAYKGLSSGEIETFTNILDLIEKIRKDQ